MGRKVSYEDCLYFIENYLHIELLDFQKILLKHVCDGEVIYGGRGCGRSTVIKGYTKYLSHLLDENLIKRPQIKKSESPCLTFENGHCIKTTNIDDHGEYWFRKWYESEEDKARESKPKYFIK